MALIDRIKFDGPPGVLVWRWPSEKLVIGSQLVVNESQEALFYKGGQALDLFGPGTHTLTTANIPLLQKLVNLPFGGKTPFTAEVYFVSKAVSLGERWGTKSPIMLLDPKYGVTIPLRGYGEYGLRVTNGRQFAVEVVGTSRGASAAETAATMLQSHIAGCVQQAFGEFLVKRKVSALDLPAHAGEVAELAGDLLRSRYDTFGIELVNFGIESINFDANDESVKRLRSMLDEAARLNVVGDAFRRNQDFYQADKQFGVLEGAAAAGGAAGGMMGAAMGVGMGMGLVGPASQVAQGVAADGAGRGQGQAPPAGASCPQCDARYEPGAKFCNDCGQKLGHPPQGACRECGAQNAVGAKFCNDCGGRLGTGNCGECGTELVPGVKFCSECGAAT